MNIGIVIGVYIGIMERKWKLLYYTIVYYSIHIIVYCGMFHDFRVHQEEMTQGMWGPWQAGETHESVFRGCSQHRCWRSSRTKGPCAFFQVCPGCIHVMITSVLIEINHNTCTRMIPARSPWIGRKDLGVQSADLMMVRAKG